MEILRVSMAPSPFDWSDKGAADPLRFRGTLQMQNIDTSCSPQPCDQQKSEGPKEEGQIGFGRGSIPDSTVLEKLSRHCGMIWVLLDRLQKVPEATRLRSRLFGAPTPSLTCDPQ
jgi:hypothetical protein